MSEKDAQRIEDRCEDSNTKLILWRLSQLEEKLTRRDEEIFKRLGSLERWRVGIVAGGAVIGALGTAAWEWICRGK